MFGPSVFGGVVGGFGDAQTPTPARPVSTDDMVPVTRVRDRFQPVVGQRSRFEPVTTNRARFDAVTKQQQRFMTVPSGIKTFLPVGQGAQPSVASEAIRNATMMSTLWNNHHAGIFHAPISNVPMGASPDGLGAIRGFSGFGGISVPASPSACGCSAIRKVR